MKTDELTFLVVDDDSLIREIHGLVLRREYPECNVTTLSNGKEFADYCGKAHLYLTDNRMPEMNGFDALCFRREKGDSTPALLITGTPGDIAGRELPENTYVLSKPYFPNDLTALVGKVLGDHYNLERASQI